MSIKTKNAPPVKGKTVAPPAVARVYRSRKPARTVIPTRYREATVLWLRDFALRNDTTMAEVIRTAVEDKQEDEAKRSASLAKQAATA